MNAEIPVSPKGALYRLGQKLFSNVPSAAGKDTAYLAKMKRLGIPPDGKGGLDPLWIILFIVDGIMETSGFYKPMNMPKYEKPSAPPPKLSGDSNPLGEFMTAFNEVMENLRHW